MTSGIAPFGGGFAPAQNGLGLSPTLQKQLPRSPQSTDGQDGKQQEAQQIQKLRDENYSHIMAHEQAHASAAGSLGGGINIVYGPNGIPVAGFVPIRIPGVNPSNPAESLAQAKQVYAAATAPGGDMSSADARVASAAMSVMGRAQVLMGQQKNKPN